MISITTKLMTVMTAGALFLGTMTPSAFAVQQISGNGAASRNDVNSTQHNTATLDQSNNTRFNNNVSVRGDTGGNRSDFNTGGDSVISTGGSSATVDISNAAGRNVASLGLLNCGCNSGRNDALISGNGAFSDNQISDRVNNSLRVSQNNDTSVNNHVNIHGKTGGNTSSFNTDGGSFVGTGDTSANVNLHNKAGSNQFGL